tara:strand:+ start:953 stop:1207 length:255 start_codon:yes stop_codon:yes gene_type:complete
MEQQNQQQDLSFTLNGKDYKYSECTEEQQQIVQQLNDLQNQIAELDFKYTQVSAAKHHFTDLLTKSIEESSSDKSKENNKESDS